MQPQQPPHQIQIGNCLRSAGHDYEENHNYWHNIAHWELTASMKELDVVAIQNEKFFKRRFGFHAPLEQRRDVIDLKNHLDLTDLEISNLKKAGLLIAAKGKPTSLCADRIVFAMGIYFFGTAIALSSAIALGLMLSNLPSLKQMFGWGLIAAILFPLFWLSFHISFHPLCITRQRGIKLGQKWVLRNHVPLQEQVASEIADEGNTDFAARKITPSTSVHPFEVSNPGTGEPLV